jgi:galactokinase
VNLIGEHTDYNDGYVLPFALPYRTAVAAAPGQVESGGSTSGPSVGSQSPMWTVVSELAGEAVSFGPDELVPGGVTGWASYVAGVVWALRETGHAAEPAPLAVASDVPMGAGLSSSAALECAVLAALSADTVPRDQWPRIARRAENEYVGVPSGIMDQSAAVHCTEGHALFLDCRTLAYQQVPFDLAGAGLAILVIDTRAPRRLVTGEYAARRADCEAAAKTLGVTALRDVTDVAALEVLDGVLRRRARHVVTENQRVLDTVALLRSDRPRDIGPLLTASHTSLRYDFEVTVPQLDTAVEAALAAGAYGARMTGGGFGGCVLALIDAPAERTVSHAVTSAFARAGFAPPATFPVTPAAGVRRHS